MITFLGFPASCITHGKQGVAGTGNTDAKSLILPEPGAPSCPLPSKAGVLLQWPRKNEVRKLFMWLNVGRWSLRFEIEVEIGCKVDITTSVLCIYDRHWVMYMSSHPEIWSLIPLNSSFKDFWSCSLSDFMLCFPNWEGPSAWSPNGLPSNT